MNRKAYASILALIFLAVVFLPGCNNSSSPPPVQSIAVSSGSPQSAQIGAAFTAPLVAVVTANGVPVNGASVTFTAPGSGASGTFASNSTATETDTTDANGLATSSVFTAGTVAGAYTVTATLSGVAQPANFSLTNTAGAATTLSVSSGSPQYAVFSTAFALPLVALVVDAGSNPVSGVSVTFTAPASGASGTFASNSTATETDVTDANGLATSSVFTANATTGAYQVVASATGLTSVDFNLTNATGGTVVTVTPVAGTTPQSAAINTAFAVPLAVLVQTGGIPTSGVSVVFAAPATGASGTFASNSTATETDTTDANGLATASAFTANANTGAYLVSATVTGVTPVDFNLTNTSSSASNTYSFYLSGLEVINSVPLGPNFYALAGSVTIGSDGTVTAGEQDYNDGDGNTSPNEPAPDTITSGTLTVDPTTGLGTLTLVTNNTNVGVAGTETLGVQFVNANHALIVQYDASATSSGSLDLQTGATTAPSGAYAFALSGVDTGYSPEVFGGVFTITGTALSGKLDVNDNGVVSSGVGLTGTLSAATPDAFGRGTITGSPLATTLAYYVVGPEVMRIIDVDPSTLGGANIGSAFGQGTGGFSDASLVASVFGIQSSSSPSNSYAAAGMFSIPSSGSFAGVGDDNEPFEVVGVVSDSPISGSYSIATNGYGSLYSITGLGDVTNLGMYMTDPLLNLLDPNNSAGGGGALLVDLDNTPVVLFGTGVLIPQVDNVAADFAGNYAFGAQDFNGNAFWEFDLVGQGSVTATTTNVLAGTANVSDPGGFFDGGTPPEEIGATVAATATPDLVNTGRFTIPTLAVTVTGGTEVDLSAVIYQASGGQLFWLGEDAADVFLGPIELQGSLTGVPGVKKAPAKTTKKRTK
jgi:hypothetical protein